LHRKARGCSQQPSVPKEIEIKTEQQHEEEDKSLSVQSSMEQLKLIVLLPPKLEAASLRACLPVSLSVLVSML
jgi:hypothetical protein